jgi:hypothetical protein
LVIATGSDSDLCSRITSGIERCLRVHANFATEVDEAARSRNRSREFRDEMVIADGSRQVPTLEWLELCEAITNLALSLIGGPPPSHSWVNQRTRYQPLVDI